MPNCFKKEVDITPFRRLYPFASHFMINRGLNYHYIDEGEGDPIIMVHGNPTWSFYYRELIKGLSAEYRAIAIDHIGCGLSDKPNPDLYDYQLKSRVNDLESFIDFLGLKKNITLVGHDWGGMISLAYALRHINRIGRIVLLNTSGFFPPGGSIPFRLWIIKSIKPLATMLVLGFNLFARSALYVAPYKKLSRDVKRGLIAPYNCWQNRIATLKFVQDIPIHKSDPSYGLVKYVDDNLLKLSHIPMLICWGDHDFVFNRTYLNEWKRRFSAAKVYEFPKAGHYILEDEPASVVSLIRNFLKDHPVR